MEEYRYWSDLVEYVEKLYGLYNDSEVLESMGHHVELTSSVFVSRQEKRETAHTILRLTTKSDSILQSCNSVLGIRLS